VNRAAATKSVDFFDELKDWSRIKHRILDKYLDIYLKKRGGANPVMYFIDGFAGPGWYGRGEHREPGSPILAARYAQSALDTGKPYRLHCIFVESDVERARKLVEAMSDFDPAVVTVMQGPFSRLATAILQKIRDCPSLFFLDPWGVKGVELSDLGPLLERPDTEFLIRLDGEYLRRLAGFAGSDAPESRAKLRRVSLVLGEDPRDMGGGWLAEWYRIGDPAGWEEWAVREYAHRLLNRSPHLLYALPYGVRETFRSRPKYYLLFATRYRGAVPLMNDVVCMEDENLFANTEAIQRGQLTMLSEFRDDERTQRLRDLMDEIYDYGVTHQGTSRDSIIEYFAVENFGVFMKKHYREAINALVKQGRARFAQGRANDTEPIYFQ
jgi:three-Cys-motif partner protein